MRKLWKEYLALYLCIVGALGLLTPTLCAFELDTAACIQGAESDVRGLVAAVYSQDIDTILSLTHPVVTEFMGGEEGARKVLAGVLAHMQSVGISLESIRFPQQPLFISGQYNEYVIVTTESIMVGQGKTLRSVNFQFGARPRGSTRWTYIEGSRVSKELLQKFFPDFPTDFAFPRVSREVI
jgi:hypothetical protein